MSARTRVRAPVAQVFAFFDDPRNLAVLTPWPFRLDVVSIEPSPLRVGSEIELAYGAGPWRRRWIVRLVEREENRLIVDETVSGPFARFRFEHRVSPARRGTWVEDRIDFRVGAGGVLGAVLDAVVGLGIRATFVYRHARQRFIFRS